MYFGLQWAVATRFKSMISLSASWLENFPPDGHVSYLSFQSFKNFSHLVATRRDYVLLVEQAFLAKPASLPFFWTHGTTRSHLLDFTSSEPLEYHAHDIACLFIVRTNSERLFSSLPSCFTFYNISYAHSTASSHQVDIIWSCSISRAHIAEVE